MKVRACSTATTQVPNRGDLAYGALSIEPLAAAIPAVDAAPSEALGRDTGASRPALARIYTELAGPTRMAYLARSRHDGRRVHDHLDS